MKYFENNPYKFSEMIITISYGNFKSSVGGTDRVITEHSKIFNENQIGHLHIFPVHTQFFKNVGVLNRWELILDGQSLSFTYSSFDIIDMVNCYQKSGGKLQEIHIHHLLKVPIQELEIVLDHFDAGIKFFIHDFHTICIQPNLLLNGREYCGPNKPSLEKCSQCKYCHQAIAHHNIICSFLKRHEMEFIVPSQFAGELWTTAYPEFVDKITVLPHQCFSGTYYGNSNLINNGDNLRIAFVGVQGNFKGWNVWRDASLEAFSNGSIDNYFHFGKLSDHYDHVKHIPVNFSYENLDAMTVSLRISNIDVAVLWSICPETYSYTYYECYSANVFIITFKNSGNIATQVMKNGNGIVLNSAIDLQKLLCDRLSLIDLVNEFRAKKILGPDKMFQNCPIKCSSRKIIQDKKHIVLFNIMNSHSIVPTTLLFIDHIYSKLRKIYLNKKSKHRKQGI